MWPRTILVMVCRFPIGLFCVLKHSVLARYPTELLFPDDIWVGPSDVLVVVGVEATDTRGRVYVIYILTCVSCERSPRTG